MAYYNYKHVRDKIPNEFEDLFRNSFKEVQGYDYEGDAGYDGDLWLLTSCYINYLHGNVGSNQPKTYSEFFENASIY